MVVFARLRLRPAIGKGKFGDKKTDGVPWIANIDLEDGRGFIKLTIKSSRQVVHLELNKSFLMYPRSFYTFL